MQLARSSKFAVLETILGISPVLDSPGQNRSRGLHLIPESWHCVSEIILRPPSARAHLTPISLGLFARFAIRFHSPGGISRAFSGTFFVRGSSHMPSLGFLCGEYHDHTDQVLISHTRLAGVLQGLSSGRALQVLILSFNGLTSLEGLSTLKHLQQLDVSHNGLNSLDGLQV